MVSCQLSVVSGNGKILVTHYPLPITNYPLPITHYPLPNLLVFSKNEAI
ncbi:MAG: hypothetical protein ACK48B_11605 [Dolichospermum sp.]